MSISLIDPVGSNFMSDFPSQNAINCDRIDDKAGRCLTSHPLQTFNPALKATTTDPVLGTGGYSRAFYYEAIEQVYVWGDFKFGTAGINAGSGNYYLVLPFNMRSIIGISPTFDYSPIIGNATLYDDTSIGSRLPMTVHMKSQNEIWFGLRINSGLGTRQLTNTGYITWAVNDGVSWNAKFQRIP